jgi:hypothetical protein
MEKIRGQRYGYLAFCKSFFRKVAKNHDNIIKQLVSDCQQPNFYGLLVLKLFSPYRNVIFVAKI